MDIDFKDDLDKDYAKAWDDLYDFYFGNHLKAGASLKKASQLALDDMKKVREDIEADLETIKENKEYDEYAQDPN